VQQSAPASGRGLPLEIDDENDPPGSRKKRFASSRAPWWRPTGTWGRAFLAGGLLMMACAFAYAFHVCKSFLEHDPHFRIAGTSDIQIVGLAEVTRTELLPVFGEDIGRNIFFVPLAERRKQLEQIPWVRQATVMRLLPDQIRIAVIERQPVAFVRHGQQIGLVDANGVLLDMPPGSMSKHHYSFPVLTGIDGGDPLPSRRARMELYLRLVGELDGNGQRLSDQISEIDLTDPEDARVLMPEQGTDVLAHFGEDHFLDRYQRYKAHIAEWRQQYPKLAAVDLRYEQQVVLEMNQGSTNTAQAAVNAENATPAVAKPVAAKPVASKPAVAKSVATKTVEQAPAPHTNAKPDAGKRMATIEAPAPAQAAKMPPIARAVAVNHANSKAPAKAPAKTAVLKAKDKKHPQTKPVAKKPNKQKTNKQKPAQKSPPKNPSARGSSKGSVSPV
jgi:cell division protein FtsQ